MAQTLPQGVKKMASMGGITEYNFPNGLSVLLYPDAAAPKLTIKVFLHCEIALAKAFYSVKLSIF
jgi:predicted Zn-dependent peptidase